MNGIVTDKLEFVLAAVILLLGFLAVTSRLVKAGAKRVGVPDVVGYLAVGVAIRLVCDTLEVSLDELWGLIEFLARIGVICLLFRAGLESNLDGLLRQLRHASLVWFFDVAVSGFAGFAVTYWVLGLGMVPSVFVAVALTPTSVGIPVGIWRAEGRLKTSEGELLLDVAEMDDLSAVFLMSMLFALLPHVQSPGHIPMGWAVTGPLCLAAAKLGAFLAVCYLFSRYGEQAMTRFFGRLDPALPDQMVVIVGVSMVFAALASFLGLSAAIGAFFAGVVFSRDPQAVRTEGAFTGLYEFFVPFFFTGIGLKLAPGSLLAGVGAGSVLLLAATAGKILGAGAPAALLVGRRSAALIALSMVPRAEICMVIMQMRRSAGTWAVPDAVFNGMMVVSAATCVFSALALRRLLRTDSRVHAP
jgi:Kef-type K+ transport system membrane component KefB